MIVEIVNTGSELLLGRVLNTHQQWLCRQLSDRGYRVARQVAVPDSSDAIETSVREALARADIILTTGGLGPTSDDLTRERIASLLQRRLEEDPDIVRHIEQFFARRNRPMPPSTRVQAQVPEGALVLHNPHGTAPGLALMLDPNPFRSNGQRTLLAMLPGPPRELRPMFLEQIVPLLQQRCPVPDAPIVRTLRSTGIGESAAEERIGPELRPWRERGLDLGYCSRVGEVEIRLSASGPDAQSIVNAAEEIVRRQMGSFLFGVENEQIEAVVLRLLTDRRLTLALAESCTGGFIGHRLTNIPGASAVLLASLVTYSNSAKQSLLNVPANTLISHGAVSESTACAMAAGARNVTGADLALAVTGIAGPSGGTADKPVGAVWIALATPHGVSARQFFNPVDRETFKYVTSQQAFEMLRRHLLGT